jgi:hypothetical protein
MRILMQAFIAGNLSLVEDNFCFYYAQNTGTSDSQIKIKLEGTK